LLNVHSADYATDALLDGARTGRMKNGRPRVASHGVALPVAVRGGSGYRTQYSSSDLDTSAVHLEGADLTSTDLTRVNMTYTKLYLADLQGARPGGAAGFGR
jgi:uncharacterized protein YjbI with pentapeptide repeats